MLTLPLLRSVLRMAETDPEVELTANLSQLRSEIELDGVDKDIVEFVGSIADRSHYVPDFPLVRAHFDTLVGKGSPLGPAGVTRLDALTTNTLPFLSPAAFRVELDTYRETVMTTVTGQVLVEAAHILKSGLTKRVQVQGKWEQVNVQGVNAALAHLSQGVSTLHAKLRKGDAGELQRDVALIRQTYDKAKANPVAQFGVLSGIDAIDVKHRGMRRGDLALVAAFTSHYKTMFCLNWAYKAAVVYGKSVAIASLEMKIEDIRHMLAILHCQHPQFFDPNVPALTTDLFDHGQFTPEQETLFRAAMDDLENNRKYGRIVYKQPEPNVTVADIDGWAHAVHASHPLDLLLIDYVALVDHKKGDSSMAQSSSLNQVIRDTKLMAVNFDHGLGLPVLSPFQTNREGLKDAEKNGGKYTLRALAWANEAERSSDFVYYLYVDDALRASCEVSCGNLKARKRPVITDQFRLYADPATVCIDNLDLSQPNQAPVAGGIVP